MSINKEELIEFLKENLYLDVNQRREDFYSQAITTHISLVLRTDDGDVGISDISFD
ncbi:hypothetical protein fHeYen901_115 [Yersinia phage fHe-Yen9-01]|uniref:Uncharacterized protein n=1 Tax=Yersinia phage fHe-Yen9-01 TaxID=1965363 RepID=A0A1V0DXL8_9CAUD|nr:hypothetical protein KNT60_gp114 [Yersinia phage fHe-Yen9-01]ARB05888.1 hypothetical protein fHeYen901_115 [Yersinia phage fHe-Yen9-01]